MKGRNAKNNRGLLRFPWHVISLAAFPAIFLYANNMDSLVAAHAVAPLVISLAGAGVLWILARQILRDSLRAGLAVSFFILLFFSYGRVYSALEDRGWFLPGQAVCLSATLLLWISGIYYLGRTKRDFRNVTAILNIAAAALVLSSLVRISSSHVGRRKRLSREPDSIAAAESPPGTVPDSPPDIYFLVFDEYAHPETMKKYFAYDNSALFDELETAGFCPAKNSRTRTPSTRKILASILNMRDFTGEGKTADELYQKITSDRVSKLFKRLGYSYVYFGNWFELARYRRAMIESADYYFNYYQISPASPFTEFQHVFWKTTMLRPFYYPLAGDGYINYHRQGALETLSRLGEIPAEIEGPKYVFAHIIPPHAPFVFGAHGESIEPAEAKSDEFYPGQYIFVTGKIQELIGNLLSGSDSPPIIILQSDHGLRVGPNLSLADGEWEKILNAFYLPGQECSVISDSISPVDTFRLIFNLYFGMDYELLGERAGPEE